MGKKVIRAVLAAVFLAVVLDWAGQDQIRLTEYPTVCPGLPGGFSGMRIALISDAHGAFLEEDALAEAAARGKPDLIAVTGDLFDRDTDLTLVAPAMAALCRVAPVFYVSGNHEWTVEDRREVWAQMEEAGVRFLEDSWLTLERNGQTVVLAGVQDPNGPADKTPPEETLAEARSAGGFLILLYHRNTSPEQWGPLGADLVLSGHGHGGLVRLPLVGGLADTDRGIFPQYDSGVYQVAGARIVVSRGLGNSPGTFRLFNGPEIPIITLLTYGDAALDTEINFQVSVQQLV